MMCLSQYCLQTTITYLFGEWISSDSLQGSRKWGGQQAEWLTIEPLEFIIWAARYSTKSCPYLDPWLPSELVAQTWLLSSRGPLPCKILSFFRFSAEHIDVWLTEGRWFGWLSFPEKSGDIWGRFISKRLACLSKCLQHNCDTGIFKLS